MIGIVALVLFDVVGIIVAFGIVGSVRFTIAGTVPDCILMVGLAVIVAIVVLP
jgi:hypothetical protein